MNPRYLIFFFSLVFVVVPVAFAAATDEFVGPPSMPTSDIVGPQSIPQTNNTTLINPLGPGITTLEQFLTSILNFVTRIGIIVIVLMTVFVGYKFVVAQGKPEALKEARTMLLWTVIGALILLGANGIARGIQLTAHELQVGY